ncbi:MAG: DUF72 domain-containing protein [Proteobacteria bacterium]|nr:DUF72 domain-containing protein [Pseudomonadota bacterium]
MAQIYCGCSDFPHHRKEFFKCATAVEHRVGLFSPPKARVLKEWAAETAAANAGMRTVWVAWQAFTHRPGDIRKGFGLKLLPGENAANLGHFQKTAENQRVWARIKEQAVNVGASRILLETSANFSPSDANKRALTDFAKDWCDLPDGIRLVWHAAGFWERDEAVSLARSLGIVPAIDPLVDEREALPDTDEIYFQMLGRHGLMDTYSDDDLACILDASARYDDVTVIFRTCDSLGDAKRLIKLSETYEPSGDFSFDSDDGFDDEDFDDEDFDDADDLDDDDLDDIE